MYYMYVYIRRLSAYDDARHQNRVFVRSERVRNTDDANPPRHRKRLYRVTRFWMYPDIDIDTPLNYTFIFMSKRNYR